MTLHERKVRLSEIAKASITDYFSVVNDSIQWKVNQEKVPTDGILKIRTASKTDKFGNTTTTTLVKLGNVIKAIHELNKMDGLYRQRSKTKPTDLNQERRTIIRVIDPEQIRPNRT